MSGGWWYGDDGERRWIEEPDWRPAPLVEVRPELIAPSEPVPATTADGEPWQPAAARSHPIVSFADAVCGLPLWPAQAGLLSEFYADRIRTGVWRLGRRSGKGRMASIAATYEATVSADAHRAHVPLGELVAIVVIANSQKQARLIHRMVRGYFDRPALSHLLVRDTDDEIELANGMVIVTAPSSARSSRGYAVAVAIFDEAAWYVDSDGSPMSGEELWQALVPATAQFPDGKVLVLSTPRWSTGWFADLCRQAASGEFADMRHWWATTRTMNPRIPDAFLEGEHRKDPASFAREYEARFESGVGAALDGVLVRASTRTGQPTLEPVAGVAYLVSIDPAYRGDTFALTVGHVEGSGSESRMVVDLCRGWAGSKGTPLDHRAVLDEVATIARWYHRAPIVLDQFAQEPVAQGLAERGLQPRRRPWTAESKAEAVGKLREYLHTERLSLPDHGPLVAQLASLERTVLPSGKPRIAAPRGQHDDYAMACLALVHELTGQPVYSGPVSLVA